ncbi:Crustacean calcium-binding protein 23 [Diplonema papillatum]|nr:Crustacean calcium-binding protein 23 [Diplonema papillatum]
MPAPQTVKNAKPVVERVKQACLRRGGNGFRGLSKAFRIMDDNHNTSLSPAEFEEGLMNYGIVLKKDEVEKLVAAFDANDDGYVSLTEFLVAVRGGMNEIRTNAVRLAFDKLDADGSGIINVHDLRGVYRAKGHPKVLSGELTEEEVLDSFLVLFDDESNPDGAVTWSEFAAYYAGLSASIDDDEYFLTMIHNAWRLDEDDRMPRRGPSGANASKSVTFGSPVAAGASRTAGVPYDNFTRSITSMDGVVAKEDAPAAPRRIVGYTGHVPGAIDAFGESFARVESRSAVPPKAGKLPPPPFKDEKNAVVRKGNAANNHSFRLE